MKRSTKWYLSAVVLGTALTGVAAAQFYGPGPGYGDGPCGGGVAGCQSYYGRGPAGGGGGPGMMGRRGGGPGRYMMGGPGMGFASDPALLEQRLEAARDRIGITAEQEADWADFVAAVQQGAAERQEFFAGRAERMQAVAAMSGPERLEFKRAMMTSRLESMEAHRQALEQLYGVLTDEQKQAADDALTGPFGPCRKF